MRINVVNKIEEKLKNNGGNAKVKLLKGDRYFNIILRDDGVLVDNLDKEPFLEWKVFEKTIEVLENNDGIVLKGNAMGHKLGDGKLPINSIEGYIAKEVYGKSIGDSVFRRVTPIVNILIWVGICENVRGKLILK